MPERVRVDRMLSRESALKLHIVVFDENQERIVQWIG